MSPTQTGLAVPRFLRPKKSTKYAIPLEGVPGIPEHARLKMEQLGEESLDDDEQAACDADIAIAVAEIKRRHLEHKRSQQGMNSDESEDDYA